MTDARMTIPRPPVPVDADLTDFRFMPLEVSRLRRSKAWLICKRRPELAFFMLNLWTAAWHTRPAGSLEDDDDVLADAAMCSPERWGKVRTEVMRGWFKASDGRLYHAVVAEKVMDSWHGKAVARWRKECDRIRKDNHRRKEKALPPLEFPPEPQRQAPARPTETAEPSEEFHGSPPDTPGTGHGIPAENALKGEGRKGIGKGDSVSGARQECPRTSAATGMAQSIPPDWQPSDTARDQLLTSRPDLTAETIARRMVEFHAWCASNAKTTFNPDATWLGFMVKTHAQQPARNGRQNGAADEDPILAGVSESLARRHLLPRG